MDSSWRTITHPRRTAPLSTETLRNLFVVRAFHPSSYVFVAVVGLVNLLHAIERFFSLPHPLVNEPEIVDDLLFHRVHHHDFFRGASQLLGSKIEHPQLAVGTTQ